MPTSTGDHRIGGRVPGERGHDRGVPEQVRRDRVEAADRSLVVVDLQDRFVRRDSGVVGERGPNDDQQVGFVHQPTGHGSSAAPERAGAERVGIGDEAFGLEGRQDRGVQPLGQRDELCGRFPRSAGTGYRRRTACSGPGLELDP